MNILKAGLTVKHAARFVNIKIWNVHLVADAIDFYLSGEDTMHNTSQIIFLKWSVSVLIGIITIGCSTEINPKTQASGTKEHNRINETESSTHNNYRNDASKKVKQ